MIKLTQSGAGSVSVPTAIRDTDGTGLLPVQAVPTSGGTFSVEGRVHPDAPWHTLKTSGTDSFLEAFSWVPYLQLTVTAGNVDLYIGDK